MVQIRRRRALREAIIAARGADLLMETDGWESHVSVAYSNASGPMAPIAATLEPELGPVPLTISEVQLIVLGRDKKLHEWETCAALPVGSN